MEKSLGHGFMNIFFFNSCHRFSSITIITIHLKTQIGVHWSEVGTNLKIGIFKSLHYWTSEEMFTVEEFDNN